MEHTGRKAFGRFLVLAPQFRYAHRQQWLIFLEPAQKTLGALNLFL
jgi:hypothetical protein